MTLYVSFTDLGAATASTATPAQIVSIRMDESVAVSHPHSHVAFVSTRDQADTPRFVGADDEAHFTPLDGILVGGAALLPVARHKLRRRPK